MTTTITAKQVEAIENAILRVAENAGPFVAFEDAAKILDELNAQGFTIIHSMPATKSEQVECALNVVLKNCVSAIDCYAEHPATTLRQALAQRDDRIEELELSLKNVQDQCDFYEGEMYQNEDAVARDANRIAELEAEVKRKDELLQCEKQSVAKRDVYIENLQQRHDALVDRCKKNEPKIITSEEYKKDLSWYMASIRNLAHELKVAHDALKFYANGYHLVERGNPFNKKDYVVWDYENGGWIENGALAAKALADNEEDDE